MARLLVVDDDADVLDLVVRWLRADGHEVLAVTDGASAIAAVEQHGAPDAAVLDVDMPGMDGVDLLGRLRERRPDLPAIFLTVLWSGDDRARMTAAGGVCVTKPLAADSLRATVGQLLARGA